MERNQLLYNYYKKEEIKKINSRKSEGMTNDEIIRLADKEFLTIEEIQDILGIDIEEEKKITKVVEEADIIMDNTEEKQRQEDEQIIMIKECNLEDYPKQPFKLYDENKKNEMMESIRINGIMQPLIVRPINNNKYQILAGHNRRICGKEVGITKFPCIVKHNLTDDEAVIYLIDTNLCTRDKISIIEKSKAYKLKYDTYKKRDIKTSIIEEIRKDNLGTAKAAMIREEKTSNGTIQRYLRLTYLIPKLQDAIENEKIRINTGEKLSFLTKNEQKIIAELINENVKISDSIAQRIKKCSEKTKTENNGKDLTKEKIIELINQKKEKSKDFIKIIFNKKEIEQYFEGKNEREIKEYILSKIENSY